MKPILNHLIVVITLLFFCGADVAAQKVTVLKAFSGYEGKVGKWGQQKGKLIFPSSNYVFYEVADAMVVIVPHGKADPDGLAEFVRNSEDLQMELFGQTYKEYAKKGKKKKGKKGSIQVVCTSISDCNGTCSAIINGEGQFIRCSGACCEPGPGVWEIGGSIAETITL